MAEIKVPKDEDKVVVVDIPPEGGISNGLPRPSEEPSALEEAGQYASDVVYRGIEGAIPFYTKAVAGSNLALNAVANAFGIGGKKDRNTSWDANERGALANLARARENTGLVGGVAEAGGVVFSPLGKLAPVANIANKSNQVIRGMTAGEKALRVGQHVGTKAVEGALHGGGGAAVRHLAETPTSETTWDSFGNAVDLGTKLGGAFGGLVGAVKGGLETVRPSLLLKALFPTRTELQKPGQAAGSRTHTAELDKALKIAEGAEDAGITGGLGQGMQTTVNRATAQSAHYGQLGEEIRDEIEKAAMKQNVQNYDTAGNLVARVRQAVENSIAGGRTRLDITEKIALREQVEERLKHLFMSKTKGNRFNPRTPVTLKDVNDAYKTVKLVLRSPTADRKFNSSVGGQILFKLERQLKEEFRDQAEKVAPDLAAALKRTDEMYHITQSAENAAAAGLLSQEGQRGLGGLAGMVGGIEGLLLGEMFGPGGRIAGNLVGSKWRQRGVPGNTLLNIERNAYGKTRHGARSFGVLASDMNEED